MRRTGGIPDGFGLVGLQGQAAPRSLSLLLQHVEEGTAADPAARDAECGNGDFGALAAAQQPISGEDGEEKTAELLAWLDSNGEERSGGARRRRRCRTGGEREREGGGDFCGPFCR